MHNISLYHIAHLLKLHVIVIRQKFRCFY